MRHALFVVFSLSAVFCFSMLISGQAEDAPKKTESTPTPVPLGQAGVLKSVDVITLADGTTVKGKIVAEGSRAVVIIVESKDGVQEKTIERAKISKIEKGKQVPDEEYFETGVVDGKEKVTKKKEGSDASSTTSASPAPAATGSQRPGVTSRATTSPAPGKSGTPPSTTLNANSKTEDLHAAFMKDKGYAGLVKIIGTDKATQLVDKSRRYSHFSRILESVNKDGTIRTRDLIDLFNRGNITLDEDTRKKALRYLTDLAFSPGR
ncbi:MAG: hypothetical protein Kow00107_11860 [Planctomycetota bacterium]